MKIQLASDLHLEFLAKQFPGERLITPHPEADVLVLAGDIASGSKAIDLFRDWPVPVVYVFGNHELYGHDYDKALTELRAAALGTVIHVLERDRVDIQGVRFLGCCLWTDYLLNARTETSQPLAMTVASYEIYDHKAIRRQGKRFSPNMALTEHMLSRNWLTEELSRDWSGRTVVVTHHGVHPLSVYPQYANDISSAAFVSDLGSLICHAALWLHGHVHNSFDYRVGNARVVTNPRGYARNLHGGTSVEQLTFENAAFDPRCLIDLES